MALDLLNKSSNNVYSSSLMDQRSGKRQYDKVDARWIQSFVQRFRIVQRAQCGKLKLSREKILHLGKETARHLRILKKALQSGEVDETDLSNADETHFVVNMYNGKTLGIAGHQEVRYADVTSAGEGMTMLVRLSGGKNAMIQPPLMVFKNQNRNYPIRNVPDNIPRVAYRTGPKGWIDGEVMLQWLKEPRVIDKLPLGRLRQLQIDNCCSHNLTEDIINAAESIRTTLRYFPPNMTDWNQPCDSFIIQKIKDSWRKRWDAHKLSLIQSGAWTKSGRLPNPGKSFFLRLAADSVSDVIKQRDQHGIFYARKAMILCRMALNTNGRWEVGQLKLVLQNIVMKHRAEFDNPEDDDNDSQSNYARFNCLVDGDDGCLD